MPRTLYLMIKFSYLVSRNCDSQICQHCKIKVFSLYSYNLNCSSVATRPRAIFQLKQEKYYGARDDYDSAPPQPIQTWPRWLFLDVVCLDSEWHSGERLSNSRWLWRSGRSRPWWRRREWKCELTSHRTNNQSYNLLGSLLERICQLQRAALRRWCPSRSKRL